MLANEDFEEYLRALDVNVALSKIANLLKPDKEIVQEGDHMIIHTLSTFRNYIMDFQVGKEFEEDLTGIDDRKCMTTVSWDGDKLECVQKEGCGWTQWIEGDELHLEMRVEGVVCKQVFKKVNWSLSRSWSLGMSDMTGAPGSPPFCTAWGRDAWLPLPLLAESVSWCCLFSFSSNEAIPIKVVSAWKEKKKRVYIIHSHTYSPDPWRCKLAKFCKLLVICLWLFTTHLPSGHSNSDPENKGGFL